MEKSYRQSSGREVAKKEAIRRDSEVSKGKRAKAQHAPSP